MAPPKFKKKSTQISAETECPVIPEAYVNAGDQKDKHIDRGNAIASVAPTSGDFPSPVHGCTAKVRLNNGNIEYWSYVTNAWVLNWTSSIASGQSNIGNGTRTANTYPLTNSSGSIQDLLVANTNYAGIITAAMHDLWNAASACIGANGAANLGAWTAATGAVTFFNSTTLTVKQALQKIGDALNNVSGVYVYNAGGADKCIVHATGPGVTFTRTSSSIGTFSIPSGVILLSHDIYCASPNNLTANYAINYNYVSNIFGTNVTAADAVIPIIMIQHTVNAVAATVGNTTNDIKLKINSVGGGSIQILIDPIPAGLLGGGNPVIIKGKF